VQAIEDSILAKLSTHDFHEFLKEDQTLALKFQEFFRTVSKVCGNQMLGGSFIYKKITCLNRS